MMKTPAFAELKGSQGINPGKNTYATVLTEANNEKELVENLWLVLNPFSAETIGKAGVYDVILFLEFNVTVLSVKEMQTGLAKILIKYYKDMDILLDKPASDLNGTLGDTSDDIERAQPGET
jgi:hypothetical protein